MSCYVDFTLPAGAISLLSTDLRTEDVRYCVNMNVSALLIFVSSISLMLHPTQGGGEFEKFLTFSLTAFKSRFIRFYFVYPNIHLSWLASQFLPHTRVEFVVGSSLPPLDLAHVFFPVFLFSSIHKYRHS